MRAIGLDRLGCGVRPVDQRRRERADERTRLYELMETAGRFFEEKLKSATGQEARAYIEKRGLKQISDSGEIEKIVDQVLAANAKSVEEFRAGKEKAFNALVGQVMKATKGKANPAQVNELLKKKLGG